MKRLNRMAKFRKISIDKHSPKHTQNKFLTNLIKPFRQGTLLLGSKLPSIRDLSAQLKLIKSESLVLTIS